MRINWFSNAPWFPSGYGVQTKVFVPRIQALGHNVSITAFAGLHGAPMTVDGTQIWPAARHRYGQDVMNPLGVLDRADCIISLLDIWVVEAEKLTIPWYPWTPVDCEPMPKIVYESAKKATKFIAMSKFGKAQAEALGLDAYYVPHGVDTKVFAPGDRKEARSKLGWPADKFIVGMVAANIGNPPRKSFFEQISAFAAFHVAHPDTMLYIHADDGTRVGPDQAVDLVKYCAVMGLRIGYMGNEPVSPDVDVLFPDQFFYGIGLIPDAYMVMAYNAMDVMTLCSLGEGFGIPLIEAQACGCPVITGDWTAMGELVFGGWKIPKSEADMAWHPFFEAFQWRVHIDAVFARLMDAYGMRDVDSIRARARDGALDYDADKVTEKYWKPILADIEVKQASKSVTGVIANGQTERVVEIPWLLSKLGNPKRILDIGSTDSWYLDALVKTGAQVTCIDTRPFTAPYQVIPIVGDAEKLPVMVTYDLITCVSVLDHVGLKAYGNLADDGKLERVVAEMWRVLEPGGRLLLTVPVGRDCVTTHPGGGQRVFSRDSLSTLFTEGKWQWASVSYWVLVNDAYVKADWETVNNVEYAGTRAGAVVGLELVKASEHTHEWIKVGLWNADRSMSVPCKTCGAEYRRDKKNKITIIEGGFENPLDLKFSDPDGLEWLLMRETIRDYDDGLKLTADNSAVDIGAHVGVVSMYLAKKYGCKVYAYEPNPANYARLVKNIKTNGLEALITPYNLAVTGDGRDVTINTDPDNSGGNNIYTTDGAIVQSTTLDDIRRYVDIDLLKIDCEGAEFEILTRENLLSGISAVRGEIHRAHGSAEGLLENIKSVVPDTKMTVQG